MEPEILFSRDDERRLQGFGDRLRRGEDLTLPESSEMERLIALHKSFLDEGERRLREGVEGVPDSPRRRSSANHRDGDQEGSTTSTWGSVVNGAYFWTSLVATAIPGYLGKHTGLMKDHNHWSFLTEQLLLGALPVLTSFGVGGNHLQVIKKRMDERSQTMGLVVACLDSDEMQGYGIKMVQFAQERDWREQVNPKMEYVHVPMPDGSAGTTMEAVRSAVDKVHDVVCRGECVYIHCKAGKGRSWLVAVCYLSTHGGRTLDNAVQLVKLARYQVNPSPCQVEFVNDFKKKFSGDEEAKKLLSK